MDNHSATGFPAEATEPGMPDVDPNPPHDPSIHQLPTTSPVVITKAFGEEQSHTEGPFAFSYPPANPSSSTSHFQSSEVSSSHSHAKFGHEREEGYSDDLDEMEDVETKPSPTSGNGEIDMSPKKKLRVTLPRGRACVACRNRKLKCTGERPCATCVKAEIECRYEEIQRRKPRHVLLEERVVELEALLLSKGEQPPPSQLVTPAASANQLGPPPSRDGIRTEGSLSRSAPSRPKLARNVSSSSATPRLATPSSAPSTSRSLPVSDRQELFTRPSQVQLSRSLSQQQSNQLALSLHLHGERSPIALTSSSRSSIEIHPRSLVETQLISFVLPYTPFLSIPLHPQRFLTLLTLEPTHPSRPHPALLSILFAEAIRILESGLPAPKRQNAPGFPILTSSMPPPTSEADKAWLLSQLRGSSLAYLERARVELDAGIRNVDRPFDLVRAGIGIARYLYTLGRFIEGWNIPVARLAVSCGLHRITGNITPPQPPQPNGSYPPTEYMPLPFANTQFYLHQHAYTTYPQPLPPLRMRPLIIPPPRDEIDLAERVTTFWTAKSQDWAAGVGWGWSIGLDDTDCTTEWPWGSGVPEIKPPAQINHRYSIHDLFDINSQIHMAPFPESTYELSMKSMCLLSRASHLNDLPEASVPYFRPDGRLLPSHIPPIHRIKGVETAISILRQRLPLEYTYPPPSPFHSARSENGEETSYDPMSDPWYILLHINLYTAEMLACREMANYDTSAYQRAIGCARGVVGFVASIKPEQWMHVDMIVAIDLSLAARLLFKECDRLYALGQTQAAKMASEEAGSLQAALAGDFARYMPMAALHALIVGRVREGLAEKEGEYERV